MKLRTTIVFFTFFLFFGCFPSVNKSKSRKYGNHKNTSQDVFSTIFNPFKQLELVIDALGQIVEALEKVMEILTDVTFLLC